MAIYTYVYIPGIYCMLEDPYQNLKNPLKKSSNHMVPKLSPALPSTSSGEKDRPRTTDLTLGGVRKLPAAWLLEVGMYVTNRCEILGDETF